MGLNCAACKAVAKIEAQVFHQRARIMRGSEWARDSGGGAALLKGIVGELRTCRDLNCTTIEAE